jgi:hypothetical protein
MSHTALTPDHLFDRPWQPGRRFAARDSRAKRWGMIALLVLLCLVIFGYGYITDSERVRAMAESYLSRLVRGPVKVGGATLSIFEGLRLDDVRVYVDEQTSAPDSLLFSAQTFLIKYDPRRMLTGQLEASQIVAQKPQVHLAENRDAGEWNYERLMRRRREQQATQPAAAMPAHLGALPELLLRNARVTISEMRGGREVARGYMTVDGRLANSSADPDRVAFQLQSRGVSEDIGPYASGSVSTSTGDVVAQLMNFVFGGDVRSMLPGEPRDWWRRHELAGAVSMPQISFTPPRNGKREEFKIVTVLNGVTLSINPEEWMGRAELTRLRETRATAAGFGKLYRVAGMNAPARRLRELLTPSKVTLNNVAGTFVFTKSGIEVKEVSGYIEGNGVRINGHIDGYRPDATLALHITSLESKTISLPPSPRWVASLPREVREVYDQFKPEGQCRIAFQVTRDDPAVRPAVTGAVDVINGRFAFFRFAYPLRNVTGRIDFGRATDGTGRIGLDVRGNGPGSGSNRDAVLRIKTFEGQIGPIGTNLCGVNVRISAENVASEDALRDAFPPEVQKALATFDAHNTGTLPQYRGDFVCEIVRPIGFNKKWTFDTDVTLRDASGVLAAFPYPLNGLTGKLRIRSGYADVMDLAAKRPDGCALNVSGRVAWTSPDGPRGPQPPYRAIGAELSPRVDDAVSTELKLRVRGMPIDDTLLAALPEDRRGGVQKLGATGKLDVDGRIFASTQPTTNRVEWVVGETPPPPPPPPAPLAYDLNLAVRDGTLRPFGKKFDVTGVEALMRLTPERLDIDDAKGRRAEASLSVRGGIDLHKGGLQLDGSAKSLVLDDALYDLLPEGPRKGWDETQPKGTLDADVHYATTDKGEPAVRVVLKPRELTTTLKSIPYKLEKLTGAITVEGNKVTVDNVTGRHGEGKISLAGTGLLGVKPVWDVRLGAEKLTIDDELRTALPPALSSVMQSVKLGGKVGFDFTRFVYRGTDQRDANPEVDVVGSLRLDGASLDVGVPLTDAVGAVAIDAEVREGRLETLRGTLDLSSMNLAGRAGKNFRAALSKPAEKTELHVEKMRGEVADGSMSGQMTLVYPDDGPSRYALDLVVRDADVRALAWEKDDAKVNGRLNASLAVEGSWGDAKQRRGRGDVLVSGQDMYRIPLVLGLLQVTNLSLPLSSPFNEATAVYSLDGTRVIFEQIKLTAKNMLMEGNGSLDFGTKKVDLTFTTDNPGGLLQLPFIKELLRGARNELLKIHVKGTIKEPEVSARSMGTFWTTVDEVFNGDRKSSDSSDKRRDGK